MHIGQLDYNKTGMHLLITCMLAHRCTFPGCGSVLVLDGNMKNQRDVCYAKDAGFIQFEGLKGTIKTGCIATPAFNSRYCVKHKNQECALLKSNEEDEDLDVPTGPAVRFRQSKQYPGDPLAEEILAKKTTRKQTYYQVYILFDYTHNLLSSTTHTCNGRSCGLHAQNVVQRGSHKDLFQRDWWKNLKLE